MGHPIYLSDFKEVPTLHHCPQEEALEWIARAHAEASSRDGDRSLSVDRLRTLVRRVGCKPDRMRRRGHELSDFSHLEWEKMEIFRLKDSPMGVGLEVRNAFFQKSAIRVFQELYPEGAAPPGHLLHVSCTGYIAPSAAQLMVGQRGWGDHTTITNVYHMGCYASIPAIRVAASGLSTIPGDADIVHTELCTLHFNPSLHDLEQLVVQSLFADGFIRYSVSQEPRARCFRVLALQEEIIPGTPEYMTWAPSDWGMAMTLSREVPRVIGEVLVPFLTRLFARAGRDFGRERSSAIFAVHPGGPKIIDTVQAKLELTDAQVEASHTILSDHGNMSSATLPYIWRELAQDERSRGKLVASLAFGPGLTVCGGLFIRE